MDSDKSVTAFFDEPFTIELPVKVTYGEVVTFSARAAPGVVVKGTITSPNGRVVNLSPAPADEQGYIRVIWDIGSLSDVEFGKPWFFSWEAYYEGVLLRGGGIGTAFYPEPSLTKIDTFPTPRISLGYVPNVPGSEVSFNVEAEPGTLLGLALFYDVDPAVSGYEQAPYRFEDKVVGAAGRASWTWRVPLDVALGRWVFVLRVSRTGVTVASASGFDIVATAGERPPITIRISRLVNLRDLQRVSILRAGDTARLAIVIEGGPTEIAPLPVQPTVRYPSGNTVELPLKVISSDGRAEWQWTVPPGERGRGYVDISDLSSYITKVWFQLD